MMIRRSTIVASVLVTAAGTGCTHLKTTELEQGDAVEVAAPPSLRYAQAQPSSPRPEVLSGFDQSVVAVERGTVQHYPTYFNDPFLDHGSDDGKFGVTWEDVVAVPYVLARGDLNFLAVPASAVVEPPWTEVYSDGRVGTKAFKDHDVARNPSATANGAPIEDPLVAPDDVVVSGTAPTAAPVQPERVQPVPPAAVPGLPENPAAGAYQPAPKTPQEVEMYRGSTQTQPAAGTNNAGQR